MAFAKKCDRCGKLYEEYNTKSDPMNTNGVTVVNLDHSRNYHTQKVLDFCPKCNESFNKWLKGECDD